MIKQTDETYLRRRTLPAQPFDLPVAVHLVVFEHGQLGLLTLVLDLFGGGIHLLLALLRAAAQPQYQVQGGFLLDVVVREGAAVFELLAGEDQALLVGRDALLVCIFRKPVSASLVCFFLVMGRFVVEWY